MDNYLMHHGVKGQKWGVENGPPYPLASDQMSTAEKKKNPGLLSRKSKEERAAAKAPKSPAQTKEEILKNAYATKNYREVYKNSSQFTLKELQEVNQRIAAEKQLKKEIPLTKKEKLAKAGKDFVIKQGSAIIGKYASDLFAQKVGRQFADALYSMSGMETPSEKEAREKAEKEAKEGKKNTDKKSNEEPTTTDIPKRPEAPKASSGGESKSKSEPKSETKSEPKSETKSAPKLETKTEAKEESKVYEAEYVGQKASTGRQWPKWGSTEKVSKPIDVEFTVREAENSKSTDSGSSWATSFLSSSSPMLSLPAPKADTGSSENSPKTSGDGPKLTLDTSGSSNYNEKLSANSAKLDEIAKRGKEVVDGLF